MEMNQNEPVVRQILAGRIPQTLLLSGGEGSGKMRAASQTAAALLCTGAGKTACGICGSCRKMLAGVHPDLMIIDEQEKEIKVELARKLRADVLVKPNDGARRVIIINHVQNMNTSAQNALLKTLEEPPAHAFFILCTEQPEKLLPTILSRCTRYALHPGEEVPQCSELVAPMIKALAKGDEFALMRAAMAAEKLPRAGQKAFLSDMQLAVRDALFESHGMAGRMLPELEAESKALARAVSPDRLLKLSGHLFLLGQRLAVNAAPAAVSSALSAGAYEICFI